MSGHSKWATIKRAKEANDSKRGTIFSRLSKDIENAVRLGESGDIEFNALLKSAVDKAKSENMPNDKIENAINKGLGVSDSSHVTYEKIYEAYGPGGVAMLIECETDNPNRTIGDVKTIITKNGAKMASEGSLSWQFEEAGRITLALHNSSDDIEEVLLELMEIEDLIDIRSFKDDDDSKLIMIKTAKENLKKVVDQINERYKERVKIKTANLAKIAKNLLELKKEEQIKLKELMEKIEECADVVNIWTDKK